jgi:CHASE2 domain
MSSHATQKLWGPATATIWHWLRRCVRHHVVSAVAVASCVVLTAPLWTPLEDTVYPLAQNISGLMATAAPGDSGGLDRLALVKIDAPAFVSRYQGQSPLDRCQLAADLEPVLARSELHTVGIDFDLSPAERGELRSNAALAAAPGEEPVLTSEGVLAVDSCRHWSRPAGTVERLFPHEVERTCQCRLNGLLDKHGAKLVLMKPLPSAHPATQERINNWVKKREAAGARFGDATLTQTRGMLREHVQPDPPEPTFGDQVRLHLQKHKKNRTGEPARVPANQEPYAARTPIAFQALAGLHRGGAPLALNSPCLTVPGTSCKLDAVVIGSGYSADDRFLTPMAELDGVDVHTAIAACPTPTHAGKYKRALSLFALEIAVGTFVFGPLLHFFWGRFYSELAGTKAPLFRAGGSFVWLVSMAVAVVVAFVLMLVFFPLLGAFFWPSHCAVRVVAVAFVVGLAIEAAVVQGHEVAMHELARLRLAGHGAGATSNAAPRGVSRHVYAGLLWAAFAVVFLLALQTLAR